MVDDLSRSACNVAESLILTSQYPNSEIQIYIEVLQNDGAEKAAAINAMSIALAHAAIAMRDSVIAVTTGIIDGQVLIDLTTLEVKSQCPVLTIGVRAHDPHQIVFMEIDARLQEDVLDKLVESGIQATEEIYGNKVHPFLRELAERSVSLTHAQR